MPEDNTRRPGILPRSITGELPMIPMQEPSPVTVFLVEANARPNFLLAYFELRPTIRGEAWDDSNTRTR